MRLLVLFLLLSGGYTNMQAQVTMSSPDMRCVSVDSVGDVTVSWVNPANWNNTWLNYDIYTSTTYTSTTYTQILPDITNPNLTSYYIPNTTANGNSGPVYFYINAQTSNGTAPPVDTLSTMYLTVNNGTGVAQLQWNALHTPLLPTSTGWYKIYREYPQYVWTLIDSTQQTSYNDTITFCHSLTLNYYVTITDASGCTSMSNRAGAPNFFETIPPPLTVMDTLSVTSANTIDITWTKSNKPNVIGYVLYIYSPHVSWQPFDTIYGINSTFYNYTHGNPSDSALSFEVAALDSCHEEGAISFSQTTLFLKVTPDPCAQLNILKWNPFVNLLGDSADHDQVQNGGYRIYCSVNNRPFFLLATTTKNITTYTDTDLITKEYRCYYIQVYDSAHHDTTASSNIVCDSVSAPTKPKNNYLRTATVIFNSSSINIVGYVDSSSSAAYYVFERAADTGSYKAIDTLVASHHTDSINYIDNSASPSTQSYRYRILTLDTCKRSIDTTNIGQTIYLTAVADSSLNNTISWNDYGGWYANPLYYLIYRAADGVNYTLIHTTGFDNAGQYVYTDNISQVTGGQGAFSYYIEAVEHNAGMYPFTDTSYSNIAIAYQNPIVFIPNAFSPNGKNKIFKPVGVFIDVQSYDFSILNRWGNLIFESNSPDIGWDGGGKEEGVYIYLLTYTSSKGQFFQQKGTVTLLK